jgi:hypothetical protein
MRFSMEKASKRREFFRASARYCFLSIAALVVSVLARRGQLAHQRCLNRGICSQCLAFKDCELPAALSARQAGKEV